MTAQMHDIVYWDGEEYALCGVNGEGLFDPGANGLTPVAWCTACWRGFLCRYDVRDDRLLLDMLCVCHGDPESMEPRQDPAPAINGVTPTEGEGAYDFFNCVYRGLRLPVPYSGGLLIGRGFIEELYVHMGFHPAWKHEQAAELIFREGRLERHRDLTAAMAEIRARLAREPLEPGRSASEAELRKWIESTFNLHYEMP